MKDNDKASGTAGPGRNGGQKGFMESGKIEAMDFVWVVWRRRWQIVVPTLVCVLIVGILSFLLPKKWEIDTIFAMGKFFIETTQGEFREVTVVNPRRIVEQVNGKTYDLFLAAELKLDIGIFPKLKAENMRGTELVRVAVVDKDVNRGKAILSALNERLKNDCNRKIDVQINIIDTQITTLENAIKMKGLDIRTMEIEKAKLVEQIASARKKMQISEKRSQDIADEMAAVEQRVKDLGPLQKKALEETKQGAEAMGALLYSNEIQANLRYHNTLADNLSMENVNRENLSLAMKDHDGEIKKLSMEIEKNQRETEDLRTEIKRMVEKKGWIELLQIVKDPTPSLRPVFPKKILFITLALVLGLIVFTLAAVSIDFFQSQNPRNR